MMKVMITNIVKLTFRPTFWRSAIKQQYLDYYQTIFPQFETLQLPQALTILENLKSIQMIDQPLWQKLESILVSNLSRITINDLSRISKLFLGNNLQISPRFYHIFDEKISRNIDSMNMEELLCIFMYALTQQRKLSQIIIRKIIDFKSDLDREHLLDILKSCVILIQSHHKINFELCQKLLSKIYDQTLVDNLNLQEMILYIDIFSPNSIKNFEAKKKINQQTSNKAFEIVTGYSVQQEEKFEHIPYIQHQDLENIQNNILSIINQKLGFQNLYLSLRFLSLIQEFQYQVPVSKSIFQEISENINLLTTEEVSRILEILNFDHLMWTSFTEERDSIKKVLKDFFLLNQKQFNLNQCMYVLSNSNPDTSDIKKILIESLSDKISLEDTTIGIITKFNSLYPKLIQNFENNHSILLILDQIKQKINSLQFKSLQMAHQISAKQAKQLMQTETSFEQNFQKTQQLICEKIYFQEHMEVGWFLHYLRELYENKLLQQNQHEQLKKIIESKIDVNIILK